MNHFKDFLDTYTERRHIRALLERDDFKLC